MSSIVDTVAIASRIRSLVKAPNFEGLDAVARRLGVPEFALQVSLDDESPHPTLDVLAAIVREYGVDPTWLIYGEYNSATHHLALDGDERVTPMTLLTLTAPSDKLSPVDAYELRVDLPVSVDAQMGSNPT